MAPLPAREGNATANSTKKLSAEECALFNESVKNLLAYIQLLFNAWSDAPQGWNVNHPQRRRLKSLEQVALPFLLFYEKQRSTSCWLFDETTLANYSKVSSEYKKHGKKLAETTVETFVMEERPILDNHDVLAKPLPTMVSEEECRCWHKEVLEDELKILWESAQHRGQLILPNTVADEEHRGARRAYWQRIGGRLLARAQGEAATEKAWCWLLSAFSSEGHHQQTTESWVCWIELLGRAAQQSLCHKRRQPVPLWQVLRWTSIEGSYLQYRNRLGRYRYTLAETFKTHYESQKTIAESKLKLRKALSTWQDNLYNLVKAMFDEAVVLLGEPSVPYCFMLTGSLSRNSAVAYSDVEMALLVEDPILVTVLHGLLAKDVDVLSQASDEYKEIALHLLHLLRLVRFHLGSLGEEGVALDESGDPLREIYLIGTAESFLKGVQAECNKEEGWPYSLLHVQESRSYGNAAGKALLAHYKKKIGDVFTGITAAESAWQSSQWLLGHQRNNIRNAQRRAEDDFDIKNHGLKPITFLIIDLASLAGVCMDSVPQALIALVEGGFLPRAIGEDLLLTWEGLLHWRCQHQFLIEGPLDEVSDISTLGAYEFNLQKRVAMYLKYFYDYLPQLEALLMPADKPLSLSEKQAVLRQQLSVWSITIELHYVVASRVVDVFAKHMALRVNYLEEYEVFQRSGLSQWGDVWNVTIAQGIYGLVVDEDASLREAMLKILTVGFNPDDSKAVSLNEMMRLSMLQMLYPIISTYWYLMPNALPTLTLSFMSYLGIALTPLLSLSNTFNDGVWQEVKGTLHNNQGCLSWQIFLEEVLQAPMEAGGLPLASHDGGFEAIQRFYTLPAAVVKQLFTSEGTPIDKSHHGRRQVGEMEYEGHHVHGKFFPELPGVEEAVQVLSQQLQLGGVALSQLFRCPYRIAEQRRDPKNQSYLLSADTLGFPLLLSQHVEGENVQDGLSDYPETMEKRLLQLHRGHFTRLLLLTLLIHPEDGQPANFILSKTTADKWGNTYRLTSVDNDHAFVAPWVKIDKDNVQMQIKTLVYCVEAMSQPLDVEVLQELMANIIRLTSVGTGQKDPSTKVTTNEQVTAVMKQWLETLDKRYAAYYRIFTEQERQYLQTPHKKPYRLPLFRGQQQREVISPLLQLTPQDVGGLYERLERLLEVLSTTEDLNSLTGLNLLQRVSPLVYPCYGALHQRYDTVQARFQHIGAKQYEEILETDPQSGQTRVRYNSCRTSTLLLQQRGIPNKALVRGIAFRPRELLQRLSDFSVIHYQEISQQLISSDSPTVKQGEKAYHGLLLDRQRGAVLRRIKHSSVSQQRQLLGYWTPLVVDTLPLLSFTLLDDGLLEKVLANKPLLHTLQITDSEHLSAVGLQAIGRQAPVLNTLVLKRCKQLTHWPIHLLSTGFFSVSASRAPFSLTHLQFLHIESCSLQRLPLLTPQLTRLQVAHCSNLESISVDGLNAPLSALTLNDLPCLSVQSFRHLLHYINDQTRLTVKGLSSVENPVRTRALLKALWEVDLEARHVEIGMSLVDLLLVSVVKSNNHSRELKGCQGYQPSSVEFGLDLRGLSLSGSWFSLIIERYSNKGIQRWQWPRLPVGSVWKLLAFASCRYLKEMTVQSTRFGVGDKPPTLMKSHTREVTALQVLPDESVMSGSWDKTLRHWVCDGQKGWFCGSVLRGHTKPVTALTVLPNGSVMSGSMDGTLRHWIQRSDGEWVCESLLKGHAGWVLALDVLSDGSVMSGSEDKTLRHWVCDGQKNWVCVSVLWGHAESVWTLAVLPDGSVMSGSRDTTLCHWVHGGDGSWVRRSVLCGHTDRVLALAVLSNGSVVSGSSDKSLRHWMRGKRGKWICVSVLDRHFNAVTALAVLPDGSIVSGSDDKSLRHWMRERGGKWACVSVLEGRTDRVLALQALPDGSIMSGSNDKILRHWSRLSVTVPIRSLCDVLQDVPAPLPIKVEWREGEVVVNTRVGMEKQKGTISSLGEKLRAVLKILRVKNGTSTATDTSIPMPFTIEEGDGFPIMIKSKQRKVLLGFMDGLLKGLMPGAVIITRPLGVDESQIALLLNQTQQLKCVSIHHGLSFSCRQRLIASQPYLTTLQWRGLDSASVMSVLQGHTHAVKALAVLPDGSVVSGSWDNTLRHWMLSSEDKWICESVLEGHIRAVKALAVLPDGNVVSGSWDTTLRHWVYDGEGKWACGSVLQGHTHSVMALVILPDGSLVSGSNDKTLRHWARGNDGEWVCMSVLEGHTYAVNALELLSDGSVVSGSWDTTLRHWVCGCNGSWTCALVLEGHTDWVKALAVLPDDSVLSGSSDKTIRHWIRSDKRGWICKSVLEGHTSSVGALAVLPDGSVLSGSSDNTIRHWVQRNKGKWVCKSVLGGCIGPVLALAVLPDGSVVSCSEDKSLCHWSVPLQYTLSLPTAIEVKRLWLSTVSSQKNAGGQGIAPALWPTLLWTCTITSSQQLVMTVHHADSAEWLIAIKAIGTGVFKGMAGYRAHTVTETYDTVTCNFHVPPEPNYLKEIQGTFEALHHRMEKDWLHDVFPGKTKRDNTKSTMVSDVSDDPLANHPQRKEKINRKGVGRTTKVKASAMLHHDSPLSSTKKSNAQQSKRDLLLTKITAQGYLTKGDEFMRNNAIEKALEQYEAGLSYLHLLAPHERSAEETKLYVTFIDCIANAKDLIAQSKQSVEKNLSL